MVRTRELILVLLFAFICLGVALLAMGLNDRLWSGIKTLVTTLESV